MDDEEKTRQALHLFFGPVMAPNDVPDLVEWIQYFVSCGTEQKDERIKRRKVFDLVKDASLIFAAFFQVYGINLNNTVVHWWIFCSLLEGLPSTTKLHEVIDIRSRPFEKHMSPATKNELARLKKAYALEDDVFDPMGGLFKSLKAVANGG